MKRGIKLHVQARGNKKNVKNSSILALISGAWQTSHHCIVHNKPIRGSPRLGRSQSRRANQRPQLPKLELSVRLKCPTAPRSTQSISCLPWAFTAVSNTGSYEMYAAMRIESGFLGHTRTHTCNTSWKSDRKNDE